MKTYRSALVCGLGDSGESSARLLCREGATVTLADRGDAGGLREKASALAQAGVRVHLGAQELPPGDFEVAIMSPGISMQSAWPAELMRRGIEILPELELGWSRLTCRTVAVTGSNGKSTVVKWLAESLREAGLRAMPGGNYGIPATQLALEHSNLDWAVLEVSSFQLETVRQFRPDVGLLLNIHPNHLDRHGTLERYTELKARLFAQTTEKDAGLVPQPRLDDIRRRSGGRCRWIGFGNSAPAAYAYADGSVAHEGRIVLDLKGTHFANEILGLAAAAVAAAIEACGGPAEAAQKAAARFEPLPHRMQRVAAFRGVDFINDSKATNLSAMAAALRMIPAKARLIAGGLAKESQFDFVKDLLARKAAAVYLVGKAAGDMEAAWADAVPCHRCGTIEDAVARAWADARPGEAVLLSPACASYDQFRNYEERGDCFIKIVEKIAGKGDNARL